MYSPSIIGSNGNPNVVSLEAHTTRWQADLLNTLGVACSDNDAIAVFEHCFIIRPNSNIGDNIEICFPHFDISRFLVGDASVASAMEGHHYRPAYPDADVADVSSALLCFDAGAIGVFSATCLLERPIIQVQFICDGIHITVTDEGVHYTMGHEQREVRKTNDPVRTEDHAFIEAVQHKDHALLICSYADALRTHQLCCDVVDKSIPYIASS